MKQTGSVAGFIMYALLLMGFNGCSGIAKLRIFEQK